jgi:hypothetical protein
VAAAIEAVAGKIGRTWESFELKTKLFIVDGFSFDREFVFLITMALEIRRTPVLYGEDAKRFLKEIENPEQFKDTRSKEELVAIMEKTKRIWAEYHASKKDRP